MPESQGSRVAYQTMPPEGEQTTDAGGAAALIVPAPAYATRGGYERGLCECWDDCGFFCLAWWCPCIATGELVRRIDLTTVGGGSNFLTPASPNEACKIGCGIVVAESILSNIITVLSENHQASSPINIFGLWHGCVISPMVKQAANYQE